MKYIDPEKPDPFNPSNLYQEDMQFIEKKKPSTEEQQPQILAQIDLMRILMRSGCRLDMFDVIINWVNHYSRKQLKGNLWTNYGIESYEKFLKTVFSIF